MIIRGKMEKNENKNLVYSPNFDLTQTFQKQLNVQNAKLFITEMSLHVHTWIPLTCHTTWLLHVHTWIPLTYHTNFTRRYFHLLLGRKFSRKVLLSALSALSCFDVLMWPVTS